ncbi:MAG: hypothetical protein KAX49_20045 [Halanaerobiales bacterium]|nr:hypothetical protein [Halanaerobiales bacterium]
MRWLIYLAEAALILGLTRNYALVVIIAALVILTVFVLTRDFVIEISEKGYIRFKTAKSSVEVKSEQDIQ